MLRRVFLAGIDNRHWTLIKSLHENDKSAVKEFIGEDPMVKPRWALL
jgi:hypothetical protein